jgi:hypothetical protein
MRLTNKPITMPNTVDKPTENNTIERIRISRLYHIPPGRT